MIRLIRAEALKVLTTRLWWGMLLGAMAFTSLNVVALIASSSQGQSGLPPLTSASAQRMLLGAAQSAYFFSLIVGIVIITTEFRHFTTRPTFLSQPHRGLVIVAKVIVAAAVGFFYAIATVITMLAIAVPWLDAKHVTLDWRGNNLAWIVVADVAVVTLYAIVGLGVGSVIRNQVAAVAATLVYLLVVEPLIGGLGTLWHWVATIYEYLPAAAASAVTQSSRRVTLLSPWAGGLVLLAWGILLAIVGWFETVKRDIP